MFSWCIFLKKMIKRLIFFSTYLSSLKFDFIAYWIFQSELLGAALLPIQSDLDICLGGGSYPVPCSDIYLVLGPGALLYLILRLRKREIIYYTIITIFYSNVAENLKSYDCFFFYFCFNYFVISTFIHFFFTSEGMHLNDGCFTMNSKMMMKLQDRPAIPRLELTRCWI